MGEWDSISNINPLNEFCKLILELRDEVTGERLFTSAKIYRCKVGKLLNISRNRLSVKSNIEFEVVSTLELVYQHLLYP